MGGVRVCAPASSSPSSSRASARRPRGRSASRAPCAASGGTPGAKREVVEEEARVVEQEARVVEEEARVVEVVMEQVVEGAPCAASSGGARTTRCTKRCNCERRSSSHSAEKPTPLTRIVCTVALCFSGSGGTMTPGYFALSCACTCGAAHACSQHAARSMRWAVAARAQGEAGHQDALRVGRHARVPYEAGCAPSQSRGSGASRRTGRTCTAAARSSW